VDITHCGMRPIEVGRITKGAIYRMTTANVIKRLRNGDVYYSASMNRMFARYSDEVICWEPRSYTACIVPDCIDWVLVSG
jgi:hypothetical protein